MKILVKNKEQHLSLIKILGNNLFSFSYSICTNLFYIRFTLALISGALILRTLYMKEIFPCNIEKDVSNPLTMLGGFVGIESILVADKENSTFMKDSKY